MIKTRLLLAATLLSFAASAAAAGAESFRPYAAGLVDRLVQGIERLDDAIDDGDLAAAKAAWIDARYGWERGETFYGEFFPELDTSMDSWPDARQGFHKLEAVLFKSGDLEAAEPISEALVDDAHELQDAFADTEITRQGLLNGLAGIAFEIGSAKATGGESPFSGTSLQDMQNNMIGVETTYYLAFAPTVSAKAPKLHRAIINGMIKLTGALRGDNASDLDVQRVMRLSEQLAGLFVRAAEPLGLTPPSIGAG